MLSRYIFNIHEFLTPSQGITKLSQSFKHSVEDEFLSLTPRNDIQGLKDCKHIIICD